MENEKIVKFNRYDSARIDVYQWDKGQKLIFEEVPDGAELQLPGMTILVNDNVAALPDVLLEECELKLIHLQYIGTKNETTVKKIELNIIKRPKKSDYIPPEDAPTFREQLVQIMDDTKEAARDSATSAAVAELSAASSATSAANAQAIAQSVRDDADAGKFDGKEGPMGPAGPEGPRGPQGEKGATGERGPQGIQGPVGPKGPQGETGSRGPQGEIGPIGPTGPKGDAYEITDSDYEEISRLTGEKLQPTMSEFADNLKDTEEELDVLYDFNKDKTYSIVSKPELGTNTPPENAKYYEFVSADGDANQESTNGYQLLNVGEHSRSYNAINFNYKDCEYKINGSTTEIAYSTSISLTKVVNEGFEIEAGTYTFSTKSEIELGLFFQLITTNGTSQPSSSLFGTLNASVKTRTVEVPEKLYIYPRVYVNNASINGTYKIMLEKGTVAHDYEPYTGGIPSPSPEYPQPITDRIERMDFKITNRNLVKSFDYDFSLSGSGNNRTVIASTLSRGKSASIIKLKPLTDYCFSQNNITSSDAYARIALFDKMPKLGSVSTRFFSINNIGEIAFKTSDSENYAMIYVTAEEDKAREFQLELGTESTPYVPYEIIKEHSLTPPRPLAKAGDVADKVTSEGFEYNNILTTYNGSEAWKIGGNGALYIASERAKTYNNVGISNYYIVNNSGNYPRMTTPTDGFLRIWNHFNNVNDFKNWLTNHNVEVIYPSVDAELLPLSDSDKEFLNSLKNIPSDYVISITDQNGKDVSYMLEYMVDKKVVDTSLSNLDSDGEAKIRSLAGGTSYELGEKAIGTFNGQTLYRVVKEITEGYNLSMTSYTNVITIPGCTKVLKFEYFGAPSNLVYRNPNDPPSTISLAAIGDNWLIPAGAYLVVEYLK